MLDIWEDAERIARAAGFHDRHELQLAVVDALTELALRRPVLGGTEIDVVLYDAAGCARCLGHRVAVDQSVAPGTVQVRVAT